MNNIKFGGCPFCGNQSCVAGQCQSKSKQEQGELDLDAICQDLQEKTYTQAIRIAELEEALAKQEQGEPVEVDQNTMELAESVGLIGPLSRTHDLHAAIQRFHDLICANATIKAALAFAHPQQRKPLTDEHAIFAGQCVFLDWNRKQPEPMVKIAYEYGVFQKAVEIYKEAAHGIAPQRSQDK